MRFFLCLLWLALASACGASGDSGGTGNPCDTLDCDDGNDCTDDVCDPRIGRCTYAAVGDGAVCSAVGVSGVCDGVLCRTACTGVDCDDGNPCTDDSCDPMDGMCHYEDAPEEDPCDLDGRDGVCRLGTCTEPTDASLVEIHVVIRDGQGVAEVLYEATCGDDDPSTGALEPSDPPDSSSWRGETYLPAGDCMMLITVRDGGGDTICLGSSTFVVELGETTQVDAILACGL